jgi:glucosamine--fructose-6-phosphate aminotransferase (isomerizing)
VPLALPVSTPEWLSPLTAIVPGQLLALHLARERGYDVDRPRAISKVTETR